MGPMRKSSKTVILWVGPGEPSWRNSTGSLLKRLSCRLLLLGNRAQPKFVGCEHGVLPCDRYRKPPREPDRLRMSRYLFSVHLTSYDAIYTKRGTRHCAHRLPCCHPKHLLVCSMNSRSMRRQIQQSPFRLEASSISGGV